MGVCVGGESVEGRQGLIRLAKFFWGAASARTRTDRHSGQLVLSGQHQAAPVAVHHTLTTTSLPLPRLLGRVFVSSTTTTTPSAAPCKPHCHKAIQKLHHNKDLVSAGWMLDAGCWMLHRLLGLTTPYFFSDLVCQQFNVASSYSILDKVGQTTCAVTEGCLCL